jgi:hypothetical protein
VKVYRVYRLKKGVLQKGCFERRAVPKRVRLLFELLLTLSKDYPNATILSITSADDTFDEV